MNRKIGFIGCGNMAKAMIGGIVHSSLIPADNVYASNPSYPSLEGMAHKHGIHTTQDNLVVASQCDVIFLAATPDKYADVIQEIKDHVQEKAIVIMIAAGQTIADNVRRFGRPMKMVRTMPSTPVLVGEGMTAVSINEHITPEEKDEIRKILESFGKVEFVSEGLMDTVSGVSGASPAYAYMFLEALADGAVLHGMPRKQAYIFAAQAMLGASKMVLETGKHPGELKDDVCSPGGATIEAVAALEEHGLRPAVIQAVHACVKKSKEMGTK